jgi:uncharacterized protein (TIGR03435 family)
MWFRFGLGALVLVCSVAWLGGRAPQSSTDSPAFDVVSVKPSPPLTGMVPQFVRGVPLPGGRWSARNATLTIILRSVYVVSRKQIVGGPRWLDTERFDIDARMAADTPPERAQLMAGRMLADRFQLRLRHDQQPVEVRALVMADRDRRPRNGLRPAAACALDNPERPCYTFASVDGVTQLRMKGQPLSALLAVTGAAGELDDTIVDRTGLTGTFDIDLDYVSQAAYLAAKGVSAGAPLITAMEDQLGVKFERRTEVMDVLVIEHAAMPDPN